MFGRRSSRQILYFPLTDEDTEVRRARVYRVGRWVDRWGKALGFVLFSAVAVPLALVLDWLRPPDEVTFGQQVMLVLIWVSSVLALYAFWRFKRQERSEHHRAYVFSEHDPSDDLEVVDLKRVVLAVESTDAEREAAIQGLLARGLLARYRVNLVSDVLLWLGTAVVVFLVFAVLVWLF